MKQWELNFCSRKFVVKEIVAKFKIENFNKSNFVFWKQKMKAILRKDNCIALPLLKKGQQTSQMITNGMRQMEMLLQIFIQHLQMGCCQLQRKRKQQRRFRIISLNQYDIDGNVIANFHLPLANGILSIIEKKKTTKEIWDHLTKLGKAKSLHSKIFLKKLYTLQMLKSTSMIVNINILNILFS